MPPAKHFMGNDDDDDDERIDNILYNPPPPTPKPPRYISLFHDEAKWLNMKRDGERATMGPAEVQLDEPNSYLRKGKGVTRPSADGAGQQPRCLTGSHLPRLPSRRTAKPPATAKANFIKANVGSAKAMRPKSVPRYIVDSPLGHRANADDTDLKYVHRNDFGAVPSYLLARRDRIRRTEEEYRRRLENKEPLCKLIAPEERQRCLDGLKANWNEAQKSLLCLPLVIDTITKINKKLKIESRLKELEKHIKEIEEHPYIYVYDD